MSNRRQVDLEGFRGAVQGLDADTPSFWMPLSHFFEATPSLNQAPHRQRWTYSPLLLELSG